MFSTRVKCAALSQFLYRWMAQQWPPTLEVCISRRHTPAERHVGALSPKSDVLSGFKHAQDTLAPNKHTYL